ncbi:unnamed protein product [Didymodactylos carnosus]|uniref:N-acetyltransferase domain-containing protein n=1 Tax=Didymodactylos carnosus TaxID=1234261 RepID=A0A813TIG1_9BILA|nr:unnamed protein product [Didymodactylos carnosus]CAF3601007.1 unnamed protein product [Didymodactylos carnosus]
MTLNYTVDDELIISRSITKDDIPSIAKHGNNETIYNNTLNLPYPYTESDAISFIEMVEKSVTNDRIFSIRLKKTNELIGICAIYWNQGIMTRVIRVLVDLAMNEWGFIRIEAFVFSWNIGSMRVLEKVGFIKEGILRKHCFKNGKHVDEHLYAILKEEI